MVTVHEHRVLDAHWIDGAWRASDGAVGITVTDPSTELPLATVPAGTVDDARRAVAAARRAFPGWSTTPLAVRLDAVRRLVGGLVRHADELADVISREVGAPLTMARRAQVGLGIAISESFLDVAADFAFERRAGNSLVVREPAGVVATIAPWNMPLLLTLQKVVPALLAGCTVVHKPSEITPLHAYLLADILAGCDLPPGVFNMVVGEGPVVGAELARNPDVDLVSLTGSTRAGRQVAALCADNVTRVHLELGGKNASIVLRDADLPAAVRASVDQACFNTGQTCLQWSRLLVPAELHDEAVCVAAAHAGRYRVGPPSEASTDLGPLVSAAAFDRVNGYVRQGIDQGAELVAGGPGRPAGLDRGWYVRPTVFARVDEGMTIAQEEVFGPVLAVMPYRDEDDAVRIANGTRYGLHGAVWSGDGESAQRVARRLRTGLVDINGGDFNVLAPFGGVKQSGLGRECGAEGLDGFCEIKSLQLPTASTEPVGPRLHGAN
jgi:aldehyde dehydrogenase (NAD+)/betaine-aldehyde dehydrogenase